MAQTRLHLYSLWQKTLISTLIASSVLLSGCRDSARPEGAPVVEKNADGKNLSVIRWSNGAEPQTLDPHKAMGSLESNILRNLYEGLVSQNSDGVLQPGVAERWEASADGKTYTFHLRQNAKWSDGSPITAEQYMWSLRRVVDPKTRSEYAQLLAPILNAESIIAGKQKPESLGVKAINASTLEIKLGNPTPYFLGLLTHCTLYPLKPENVNKNPETFTQPEHFIGNGAYILDKWKTRDFIRLKRNPYYWNNNQTKIDIAYFYPIEDSSAAYKRYRAGDLDWLDGLPTGEVKNIKRDLPKELKTTPSLATYYFGFNVRKPPMDNKDLRKALSLAINRDFIIKNIGQLDQPEAYSWVPPGVKNYTAQIPDYAKSSQAQREAEAKKLFAKAGYGANKPLKIEILYNTSEGHKLISVAIADMWKRVLGVETTLVNKEWKVYLDDRQSGNTQVYRAGWFGDYDDANTFAEILYSKHGMNDMGYKNPEYDRLWQAAQTEVDIEKRADLLQQAEKIMVEDQAILPIYFYVTAHLQKPWVQGWKPQLLDYTYLKNLEIKK